MYAIVLLRINVTNQSSRGIPGIHRTTYIMIIANAMAQLGTKPPATTMHCTRLCDIKRITQKK